MKKKLLTLLLVSALACISMTECSFEKTCKESGCDETAETQEQLTEDIVTESVETTETHGIVENSETIETEDDELTELEKKIVEFKNNTPSEVTLIQDLLRGEWHINGMEVVGGSFEEGFSADYQIIGEVEVNYDTCSRDSSLIFTNDEFIIVYEGPYVKYIGNPSVGYKKNKELQNAIVVSGLYRVKSPATWDEDSSYCKARIEMLVTNVTQKNEIEDEEIFELLNKAVGMTFVQEVEVSGLLSIGEMNITKEELESRNVEIHEAVDSTTDGYFGYREDGSYGLILYDTPIPTRNHPITNLIIYGTDKQLNPTTALIKIKNSVDIGNGEVEPGVFLYDVKPQEDEATKK